ncbi:MAG: hypothetical protein JST94_03185 [Bacteroidetes bacterium]|nr:hypothetical protein [Bacteroidota bacterium]MBS1670442.1 hypothetical protein [Bacteroidota bacterium]
MKYNIKTIINNTGLFIIILTLALTGCKTEADKARDVSLEKMKTLIEGWMKQSHIKNFTIDDRKLFIDEMKAMMAENEKAGLTKQNLDEKQLKELNYLYSQAAKIAKDMAMQKFRDEATHRGTNWAGDDTIDDGIYNLEFKIK